MILSGLTDRESALKELQEPLYPDVRTLEADRNYFIKKLGITEEEYEKCINLPTVDYSEYANQEAVIHSLVNLKRRVKSLIGSDS